MALVYPHDYVSPLNKCVVRIDDAWYDVTAWRLQHPGGAQVLDDFNGKDASDAFYSLHSKDAKEKLENMKGKPCTPADGPRDAISLKFAAWRKQLVEDGWWERNWVVDFCCYIIPCFSCLIFGSYISYSSPILATLILGLGMQQAGWLGHDYAHAQEPFGRFLGGTLGGVLNGFSTSWWSHKHNNFHHNFPNRKGFDSDVHNEPVIHLWWPEPSQDVWWRPYQHRFYLVAYALLFVSWRIQSLHFVLGSKNWGERGLIAINYIWMACLPWKVALGSIILGGWLVAVVVTSNHQTESMIEHDAPYNYIIDQFKSTRGVECSGNWLFDWLFGGMQYQMEHHLFPTLPKQKFQAMRPHLNKFAKDNGLQHHISGVKEIFVLNYETMKKYAGPLPAKSN